MSKTITLGGDRIRSGNKMQVELHGYDRATFNLDKVFKSSTNCGVLTPCYVNVGLNGDNFKININELSRTLPTTGPLMGRFKLQCDFFVAPIRLYNGLLHNNALGIGMKMEQVKLPKLLVKNSVYEGFEWSKNNINNASLLAYCGVRGLGYANEKEIFDPTTNLINEVEREFNAIPIVAYYDIFKNYYANKQEKQFPVVKYDFFKANGIEAIKYAYEYTNGVMAEELKSGESVLYKQTYDFNFTQLADNEILTANEEGRYNYGAVAFGESPFVGNYNGIPYIGKNLSGDITPTNENAKPMAIEVYVANNWQLFEIAIEKNKIKGLFQYGNEYVYCSLKRAYKGKREYKGGYVYKFVFIQPIRYYNNSVEKTLYEVYLDTLINNKYEEVNLVGTSGTELTFKSIINEEALNATDSINISYYDLEKIDKMREDLLNVSKGEKIFINNIADGLFEDIFGTASWAKINKSSSIYNGLCLKTYQSDIFNNWLDSETIVGANGISEISKVSTADGGFTIDDLNMAQKVYNMLNRLAVSGGTYEDWQEVVYDVEVSRKAETPYYVGGTSSMIQFDEVVSTADTQTPNGGDQPLGSLAGKGYSVQSEDNYLEFSINEPSFIIGMLSITPIIDYSQGNKWYMTVLDSLDDLHKPAFDGIGFQDLMAERLAGNATILTKDYNKYFPDIEQMAVGKQPAWLDYQTDYNEVFGEFADEDKAMFMVLNRRYDLVQGGIIDATTYIDPNKYNYAFADTRLASANFWVQLAFNITARRKMSAKIIPNI